jgi:hypothetical protein
MIKKNKNSGYLFLVLVNLYGSMKASSPTIFSEFKQADHTTKTVTPAFQNPIHPSDLSTSSNPQFTIKNSGRYYLSNHLDRSHNTAAGTILLINASNVFLNLNTKTIAPSVSGSLSTGTAIAVTKGKSNVQISNGSIIGQDSSANQKISTGINLSETSLSSGSGTSYQIKLRDLRITRCKSIGITGSTINDLLIDNCQVQECSISSGNVTGGVLTTVNNLNIQNCDFSNHAATSGTCDGLKLIDCVDGWLTNITANGNSGSSYATGINLNYSSVGCKNLQLNQINVSNNLSNAGIAIGLAINDSPLISLYNCIANNNTSSATDGAAGISLYNTSATSDNCKLINIQANRNHGTDYTAYGLYIESSCNYLENIQANSNYTAGNASVAGIYLTSSNSNTLKNCQADNNYNSNTGASSSANAFGIAIIGNNNYCQNCSASRNQTTANSTVRAVGFYCTAGNSNRFENCIANGNNAAHTSAAVKAAGFDFNSTETSTQILNCTANYNLAGNGTTSGASARAYGIYFDSTTGATNCQIRNCYMTNNAISSSGLAFGFYDNRASVSTTILTGNIAIGQGRCLGAALDANRQWNANSEPTASQNYFFKTSGTGDDPRNVITEIPHQSLAALSTASLKWQNVSVY